jgi:hypothetical protein
VVEDSTPEPCDWRSSILQTPANDRERDYAELGCELLGSEIIVKNARSRRSGHYRAPFTTARAKMALCSLHVELSEKTYQSSRASRRLCWGGSQSAPVFLQTHNVARSKPAIFTISRLECVFAPILFGDRLLPKEDFVPLSIFVHLCLIRIPKRMRSKKEKQERHTLSIRRVPYVPSEYGRYVPGQYMAAPNLRTARSRVGTCADALLPRSVRPAATDGGRLACRCG